MNGNFKKTSVSVIFSSLIIAVAFISVIIHFFVSPLPIIDSSRLQEVGSLIIVDKSMFFPEVREKVLYFVILFLLPLMVFLSRLFFDVISTKHTLKWHYIDPLTAKLIAISFPLIIFLLSIAAFAIDPTTKSSALDMYFPDSLFRTYPLIFLGCLVGFYLLAHSQIKRLLSVSSSITFFYKFLAIWVLILLCCYPIFNPYNGAGIPYGPHHFNAVFYDVAQFYLGGKIGINAFIPQYGFYPMFLFPLFKVFGFSTYTFTIVMGCLTAASFLFIYFIIKRISKSEILSLVTLLATCYFYFIRLRVNSDIYFQFIPIRSFFPLFITYLVSRNLKLSNVFGNAIISISVASALLWNPDSGIACMLAWFIYYGFSVLYERRISPSTDKGTFWSLILHLSKPFITVVLTLLFFVGLTYFIFGYYIHLSLLFKYPAIYSYFGLMMLPMPNIQLWILPIILILAAEIIAIETFFLGDFSEVPRILFFIAVLITGIFAYYQGRSHGACLIVVLHYVPLLAGVLFYYTWQNRHISSHNHYFSVCLFFLLGILSIEGLRELPVFHNSAIQRVLATITPQPGRLAARIQFLQSKVKTSDQFLLFSENHGLFIAEL